jgi:ABC-type phosphate/phosphonate transport system substrate-binding protein
MTLFFGQVDAAVETRAAFETAVELNPQIGRGVKVLARSPGLLQGLVCVRRSLDPSLRRRYLDKALTMHLAADSRQNFMVLRVQRLVPFEPRFLADTRALADRFEALRRKAGTR